MDPFEPSYPIRTARLRLRPFEADDLDAVYDLYRRPEVVRFLYEEPMTRAEAREALERKRALRRLAAEGDGLALALVVSETGRLVGQASLRWRSVAHRQGEIGFIVHPEAQGLGYATEAARAVLALGFDGRGLHRIYGSCDARNRGSAAVMERLGMRREAQLVHNQIFKGEWGEEWIYALLEAEWRASEGRSHGPAPLR